MRDQRHRCSGGRGCTASAVRAGTPLRLCRTVRPREVDHRTQPQHTVQKLKSGGDTTTQKPQKNPRGEQVGVGFLFVEHWKKEGESRSWWRRIFLIARSIHLFPLLVQIDAFFYGNWRGQYNESANGCLRWRQSQEEEDYFLNPCDDFFHSQP